MGALHHPSGRVSELPSDTWTALTSRHSGGTIRKLGALELVKVDIVDDGEKLSSFPDGQLDFIIANHMIEHTANPLGTIRNHLRKIREGGVLYYAVPDKRYTFDVDDHSIRAPRPG